MLRKQTYEIDGQKFSLRDPNDLDLEEDSRVQNFFKDFYAPDKQTISGSLSADEMSELLQILVVPKTKLPETFSFKKTKRGVAAKIIADFFLNSVFSTLDTVNSLKSSIAEQKEL
jgi:hypothetical protein